MDDDTCISPTDAQQWIYDRARGQQSVSSFIANNRDIEEEDEDLDDQLHDKHRRDSEVIMFMNFAQIYFVRPSLSFFLSFLYF